MLVTNYDCHNSPQVGDTVAIISSFQDVASRLRGRTGKVIALTTLLSNPIVEVAYTKVVYTIEYHRLMKIEL